MCNLNFLAIKHISFTPLHTYNHVVNPAIMPAEDSVGVVQGLTVELEVYVSGYPKPTSSHITWYYPNSGEISDTDTGVEFQDSSRRLILSNVQPEQAGLYECVVILSASPYMGASTSIMLNIYGKSNNDCSRILLWLHTFRLAIFSYTLLADTSWSDTAADFTFVCYSMCINSHSHLHIICLEISWEDVQSLCDSTHFPHSHTQSYN